MFSSKGDNTQKRGKIVLACHTIKANRDRSWKNKTKGVFSQSLNYTAYSNEIITYKWFHADLLRKWCGPINKNQIITYFLKHLFRILLSVLSHRNINVLWMIYVPQRNTTIKHELLSKMIWLGCYPCVSTEKSNWQLAWGQYLVKAGIYNNWCLLCAFFLRLHCLL